MIERIHASREKVRKFGILFGVLCLLLMLYWLYRGASAWPFALAGLAFFVLTAFAGYPVLRPVYIGWMTFAFILGWLNTRFILGLFFYCILTPLGLVMRLTGKDLLDLRMDRSAKSYWIRRKRSIFDRERCERLF